MSYSTVIFGFIGWWYSGGLRKNIEFLGALFGNINNLFSIREISRTFFSPWRRIVGERRKGWDGFRDFLIDNLVSRSIGVVLRIVLLIAYVISMLMYLLFYLLTLLTWVLMPLIILISIINLSGVFL